MQVVLRLFLRALFAAAAVAAAADDDDEYFAKQAHAEACTSRWISFQGEGEPQSSCCFCETSEQDRCTPQQPIKSPLSLWADVGKWVRNHKGGGRLNSWKNEQGFQEMQPPKHIYCPNCVDEERSLHTVWLCCEDLTALLFACFFVHWTNNQ